MLLCNIVVILQFVSFPFTDWQVANNTSQIGGFFSSVNLIGTHATVAWVPLYKNASGDAQDHRRPWDYFAIVDLYPFNLFWLLFVKVLRQMRKGPVTDGATYDSTKSGR